MIIKINQTKANFAGNFEIIIDDKPAYTGASSWFSSMLSNKLLDLGGNTVLESHFLPFEELKNSIPFKWAWSEQQTANHAVLDNIGSPVALFYAGAHGISEKFSEKYVVKYGSYELSLYPIDKGRQQLIPIFLGDAQIGQLNKDNFVEDNKDWYRLYLLDEYKDLAPVLSLFVIYYDSYNYGNRGEAVCKTSKISYQWTYSKYKKLYDPNWLSAHFDTSEELEIVAAMKIRMKKRLKLIWGVWLGLLALFGTIFAILWFTGAWPK